MFLLPVEVPLSVPSIFYHHRECGIYGYVLPSMDFFGFVLYLFLDLIVPSKMFFRVLGANT